MNNEQKLIAALETTIETQKQLIRYLSAEIDRLNLTKLVINPQTYPLPGVPGYPYYAPMVPSIPFTTPINPPPIVTCDGPTASGSITINGSLDTQTTGYVAPAGAAIINGYLKEALQEPHFDTANSSVPPSTGE